MCDVGTDKRALFEGRVNADASQARNDNAEHANEIRMVSAFEILPCNSRFCSNYDGGIGRLDAQGLID